MLRNVHSYTRDRILNAVFFRRHSLAEEVEAATPRSKNSDEIDIDDDEEESISADAGSLVVEAAALAKTSSKAPPADEDIDDEFGDGPSAGDVDDEFGDDPPSSTVYPTRPSTKASDPNSTGESLLSDSKAKLLLEDIDDEFGDTSVADFGAEQLTPIDVKPNRDSEGVKNVKPPVNVGAKNNKTKSDTGQNNKSETVDNHEKLMSDYLKRKIWSDREKYAPKITDNFKIRVQSYEGTQAIEYPRHSDLNAEDQRNFLNCWLLVRTAIQTFLDAL